MGLSFEGMSGWGWVAEHLMGPSLAASVGLGQAHNYDVWQQPIVMQCAHHTGAVGWANAVSTVSSCWG